MKAVNLPSFLLALLLHLCFSAARENSLQVHPKEKVHQLLNEQPIHGVNLNVSCSAGLIISSSRSRKGGNGEMSLWRREMGEERNMKKSSGGSGGKGGGGGKGVGSGGKGGEGGGSQSTRQPRNQKSGTHLHSLSSSTHLFLVSFLLLLWSD